MKRMLAYLLVLATMPCVHAQTTFEMGAGLTASRLWSDGTWYQDKFPHVLHKDAPAFEIGTRTDVLPWVAIDTRAFFLGRFRSDAWAVSDETYDNSSPTGCRGPCSPLLRFIGHGSTAGVSALLELHTTGAWQWGVAAGPVLYRNDWTIDLPEWFPTKGAAIVGPTQYNVHLHATRWSWRHVVELRLTHDRWYGSLAYHHDGVNLHGSDDFFPPLWKSQVTLTVGYRFRKP